MNKAEFALTDYKVGKELAHGGFGYVFSGEAKDGTKVALKYERTYDRINRPYLQYEAAVYRVLQSDDPCVPQMYAYGREVRWNIMVTDLLGTSLESLLEKCGDKFSLKTMLMLAPQMIECVQYVHSKGVLHRDIKPDNFLMGLPGTERENKVHIVDFGLARRYTHPKTGKHLPRTDGHSFFGTKRFASLAALDGKTQGRKDDLESVSYSLIYFLRESLPWQGLRGGTDKHRDMRVREKKRSWTAARLCEGLPGQEELTKMLDYVRSLNYEDEPDYEMLKNLFYDRLKKEGWTMDYDYDWKDLTPRDASSSSSSSISDQKHSLGNEAFPKPPKPPMAVGGEACKEESEETVEIKIDTPAPAVFDPEADRKLEESKPSDSAKPVGEAPASATVQEEDEDADDEKSTAADYNGRSIGSDADEEPASGEEASPKRPLPTPKEAYVSFMDAKTSGEGNSSPADKPGTQGDQKRSASIKDKDNVDAIKDVDTIANDDGDGERTRVETTDTAFFTADSASVASTEVGNDESAKGFTAVAPSGAGSVSDKKPVESAETSTKTPTKAHNDAGNAIPEIGDDEQPIDVVDGAVKADITPKEDGKPDEPAKEDEPAVGDIKNEDARKDEDHDDDDDDAHSLSSFSFPDTPLKRGDVVLAKLFARKTFEYDSDNGSEPSDTSYWHNPNLSQEEWKFKYRPGVVTDIQESDFGYLKIYLVPLMAREDGLERVAPPRRQAFIALRGDQTEKEGAASASADGMKEEAGSGTLADSSFGDAEKTKSEGSGSPETKGEPTNLEAAANEEALVVSVGGVSAEMDVRSTKPIADAPPLPDGSEKVESASPGGEVKPAQVDEGTPNEVDEGMPNAVDGSKLDAEKPSDAATAKEATAEKPSTKPEEDKKHDIVVEATPAWPLKGSFIHHQYCSFRVNVRSEDTEDIEVKWRLNKEDYKRLQSVRSSVFDSLKIHEPYSEDEKETAEVRWRQRKRAGIRSYPIFGELASLTEDSFKDPGVIWTGSTGWLPEFQKIDKRRDKENRSEIGSDANHYSDLDDDDENVSNFTGGAPGNRRMSCTLDIGDSEMETDDDFDSFSAMESLLSEEEDDMRSEDTRRTDKSSLSSRASSRHSECSSKGDPKRPKIQTQKSLRRNILKEAARVAMNAKWAADSELDSDPELTSPVTPSESVVSTVPPSLVASDSEASLDDNTSSRVDSKDTSSAPSHLKDTDASSAVSLGESDASNAIDTAEMLVSSDSAGGDNASNNNAKGSERSEMSSDSSDDSIRYTRSQKGKWKAVDTDISSSEDIVTDDPSEISSESDESYSSGDDNESSPTRTSEDYDMDSVVDSNDAFDSDSDSGSDIDTSDPDSHASEFVEDSAGSNASYDTSDIAEDATESSCGDNESDAPTTPADSDSDSDKENEAPLPVSTPASSEPDNRSASDASPTAEQDQDDLSVQSNFGSSTASEARVSATDILDIPYIPPQSSSFIAVPAPPPPSTGGSVIVDDGGYNRQSSQATRKVMIDRAVQTDPTS